MVVFFIKYGILVVEYYSLVEFLFLKGMLLYEAIKYPAHMVRYCKKMRN